MLRCADDRYYVGHTDALEHRVAQHQAGKGCSYTAKRLPVHLIWSQEFPSRAEALTAERQIKGWSRAKKEALIAGDWARLHELAASRQARPSTTLRTNGVGVAGVAEGSPMVLSEVEAHALSETPAP
ncbi:GIY-YIG nuclease family protein [Sphingomonas oryzagri]